jgi:hypothetical protein
VIVAKILTGLTSASRRRVVAALGLALAAALKRVGRFEVAEVYAWRGVPDAAYIGGEKINIELSRRVDAGAVDAIAEEFRKKRDGVTASLTGRLGRVELGVDIDIYASDRIPVRAAITSEGVEVLAEPRGHVEGKVVESFYELFDIEHEKMRALVEELTTELCRVELEVETYTGTRTRPLWSLVARMYALRDYSFAPEDAAPLWYRPWVRQMARDLYKLLPPELKMRNARRAVAPELLRHMRRFYDVELYKDAMRLIPHSAKSHRDAVAELRRMLTEAVINKTKISRK